MTNFIERYSVMPIIRLFSNSLALRMFVFCVAISISSESNSEEPRLQGSKFLGSSSRAYRTDKYPKRISPKAELISSVEASSEQDLSHERLDHHNRRTRSGMFSESEHDILHKVLFYLPNRAFDFFDIFRADVGIGSSGGAVIRASRYGQIGYRYVEPVSYRLGIRGRRFPFFIERDSEYGVGGDFVQSDARHVTPLEVGLGLDLVLVGGYLGASLDEAWDFLKGWVLIDSKSDDF